MAGTFGQQLAQRDAQQQQGQGLSRTQRVILAEKDAQARREFEALQKQAQDLQSTEFSNISFEEYTEKYNKLSPQLQQFFASPEQITTERNARIVVEKQKYQAEITNLQAQLQQLIATRDKYIADHENNSSEWWSRNRKSYEKRIDDYNMDIREKEETINYSSGEAGKIDQGATANDVINYGEDKADYNRRRREARSDRREEFSKKVKTGSLDEDLKKLGLDPKNVNFSKYQSAVSEYNKKAEYNNQLITWSEKVGFENLPAFAQEKINPSAVEWQKANPTEKLVFDKMGNVIGVQSGKLQQSMSLDAYNKLASASAKTPQQQYSEWQTQRSTKPIYLDMTSANVTMPYETRGTINTQATSTKLFPMQSGTLTPQSNNVFQNAYQGIKNFIAKTPDIKIPIMTMGFLGGGGSIKLRDITDAGKKDLDTAITKKAEEMYNASPNKEKVDTTFQEEYQTRFEDAYMKKIIFGEIDFETASAEFEKSDTAKIIATKYSTAMEEDTKNFPLLQKWKYGTQLTGLQVAKLGVNLIPNNYGELVVESALVYTGVKALKYVPSVVNFGVGVGFFGYGTYKAFSSKSTPMEAGSGLITAIVSGASVGYSAYRWANAPNITTKSVKVPKNTLYSSGTIGKDLRVVTDTKELNKVVYGEQKLSQTIQAGRRTIVTTNFRSVMNKYLGFNMKNIYEGIPTAQKGLYGSDVFRGGNYKITLSGYDKAMKKLLDYGWTKSQATRTLRFYAPKVTEQWLKSGLIDVGEASAKGKFIFETRKPAITINESLGIKTRGGKVISDIYKIDRKLVTINDQEMVLENKLKVSAFLNKKGSVIKLRNIELSNALTKVKASDLQKGYDFIKKQENLMIYRSPAEYKDLFSLSKEGFSLKITPTSKKTVIEFMNNQRKYEMGKATLFEQEIDLRTKNGISIIQKGNPKAFPETKVTSNIDKVISKITNNKILSVPSDQATILKDVSSTPKDKTLLALNQQLKSEVIIDKVKLSKIKNIANVKIDTRSGLIVGNVGASALQLKEQLKQQLALKLSLKEAVSLKQVSSETLKLKSQQKTAQLTKQILMLRTTPFEYNMFKSGNFRTSIYPQFKPFIFVKPTMLKDIDLIKEKIRRKFKPTSEIEGLFPDFTARAIGLAPKKVKSVKDALREMSKIQTGFEVRTGARLTGYSPIDEKSLLRGMMK